jgi:putative flippase GtrA
MPKQPKSSRSRPKQFTLFILVSGVAAIVNLSARWAFSLITPFEWAVAIAFFFGLITAFTLGRHVVFGASGRGLGSEFVRFLLVNLASLALVWSISVLLARIAFPAIGLTWHPDDIAHFIGVLSPAALSYFGHRAYTFAPKAQGQL